MNLLTMQQTIRRLWDEMAALKARVNSISTPAGEMRFGATPIVGLLPTHTHQGTSGGGKLDHGLALLGLGDDDHPQYLLLLGRSGGQTVWGGIGANDVLKFESTTHGTKGYVLLGTEPGTLIGLGTITPTPGYKVDVIGSLRVEGTSHTLSLAAVSVYHMMRNLNGGIYFGQSAGGVSFLNECTGGGVYVGELLYFKNGADLDLDVRRGGLRIAGSQIITPGKIITAITAGTHRFKRIVRLESEGLGDAFMTAFQIYDGTNVHGQIETVATQTSVPGSDGVGLHFRGVVADRDIGFTTPTNRSIRWYVGAIQKMTLDATSLKIDVIDEKTAAAGVTIDTVLIKDGLVDGRDVSGIPATGFFVRADKDADGDYDPLTAAAWENVTKSGDGTINWNTVFGVPAGAIAVLVDCYGEDDAVGTSIVLKAKSTTTITSFLFVSIVANVGRDKQGIVPIGAAGTSFYGFSTTFTSFFLRVVGWYI